MVAFSAVIALFLIDLTLADVINPIASPWLSDFWSWNGELLGFTQVEAQTFPAMGLPILDWVLIGGGILLMGLISRHNSS